MAGEFHISSQFTYLLNHISSQSHIFSITYLVNHISSSAEIAEWLRVADAGQTYLLQYSRVYMCDTPLTRWRGGGFLRHVSSSFIEHQVSSRPWLDCIPSPYSQPNAGVSMSVVSREEVSTNCRNLQLRPSALSEVRPK